MNLFSSIESSEVADVNFEDILEISKETKICIITRMRLLSLMSVLKSLNTHSVNYFWGQDGNSWGKCNSGGNPRVPPSIFIPECTPFHSPLMK